MKKFLFLLLAFSCVEDPGIRTTHDSVDFSDDAARIAYDPPLCNSGVWYQQNNLLAVNPIYVLDTDFYVDLYAHINGSVPGTWMSAPMSITWRIYMVDPTDPYPSSLTLLNVTGATYTQSGTFQANGYVDITFTVSQNCPAVSGPGDYHHIKFYHKFGKLLGGSPAGQTYVELGAEITTITNPPGGSHTKGTHDYGMSYYVSKIP